MRSTINGGMITLHLTPISRSATAGALLAWTRLKLDLDVRGLVEPDEHSGCPANVPLALDPDRMRACRHL
jgi:hypothetical protein